MEIGKVWSFDILKISKFTPNILLEVSSVLLEPLDTVLQVSPMAIRNFVTELQRLYPNNPYHNVTHAACTAHFASCLVNSMNLSSKKFFSPLDNALLIIAALGHDTGHPGRNNMFYIKSFDHMALIYNDLSILEKLHTALVFRSMQSKSCNVLSGLDETTRRDARRKIIELILSTDMAQHFEFISKLRLRLQSDGFDFNKDTEDSWLISKTCIKMADLGHACVDWDQHREWSIRITEEFYQQGDDELKMGLPISPLCDRSQHKDFAKSQKGFLEFVVQPLVQQILYLAPTEEFSVECFQKLQQNQANWEKMVSSKADVTVPPDISLLKTDSTSCKILLMHLLCPSNLNSKLPSEADEESLLHIMKSFLNVYFESHSKASSKRDSLRSVGGESRFNINHSIDILDSSSEEVFSEAKSLSRRSTVQLPPSVDFKTYIESHFRPLT